MNVELLELAAALGDLLAEGDDPGELAARIAAHLPRGWQNYLQFEL